MELDPTVSAFVAVVNHGTFTEAAKRLGLTKSAVSKRVLRLEEHLEVQLLTRNTRGIRLTDIGARYFAQCKKMVEAVSEAHALLQDARESPSGVLRVSLPYAPDDFVEFIAEYRRRNPDVRLEIDIRLSMLDDDSMNHDISLVVGDLPDSGLRARALGRAYFQAVAAPSYVERAGVPTSFDDLRDHEFVVSTPGSGLDVWQTSEGPFTPVGVVVSNAINILENSTLAGFGIGLLPDMLATPRIASGELVPVLTDVIAPFVDVHVVYPPTRRTSPAQRAFLDLLLERFEENPRFPGRIPSSATTEHPQG